MASKACDMFYGGLSMIKPGSLVIDQSLKLEEPELLPRATPATTVDVRKTPLWPALRVDSEATMPTVLVNWAACLLSRPNQLVVLSFASRLRVPYVGRSDKKWLLGEFDPVQEDVFPSWYPLPWLVTSRLTDRFVGANGCPFSACNSLVSKPRISVDGSTLQLGAAINILTAEPWGGDRDGDNDDSFGAPLTRRQREIGFCHFIDSLVGEVVDAFCKPQSWSKTNNFIRDIVGKTEVTGEQKMTETEIRSEYEELKAATPTAPWPGTDACDVPGEEAVRLRDRYRKAYRKAMKGRSIFGTREGWLTLAPCWAAERDVVMLVKGAAVPYVFTPIDEYLARLMTMKRKNLADVEGDSTPDGMAKKERIQQELAEHQAAIGQREAYVVVGEAYIDGFMYGEGLNGDVDFRSIDIV
ncbi:hypothetical protein PG984_013054 [Apiospora sp. TS-2023a]